MPCRSRSSSLEPERGERLADVQVGLAGGHEADPGAARPRDDVEAAAADVLDGDGQPGELLAALQLGELRAEQAGPRLVAVGAQAARQVRQVGGLPVRADLGGGRAVGHGGDHLHGRPQPAGAGEFDRVHAVDQGLGGVGRVEGRHGEAREGHLRRARQGGGLGRRVVADECHRSPGRRGPDHVRVPQRVGGPVQAGRLAVPDAGDAVVPGVADAAGQLGAGHRRRRQLLVEARPVHDAVLAEQVAVAGELEVVAAERRALVAGHVGGRREAALRSWRARSSSMRTSAWIPVR